MSSIEPSIKTYTALELVDQHVMGNMHEDFKDSIISKLKSFSMVVRGNGIDMEIKEEVDGTSFLLYTEGEVRMRLKNLINFNNASVEQLNTNINKLEALGLVDKSTCILISDYVQRITIGKFIGDTITSVCSFLAEFNFSPTCLSQILTKIVLRLGVNTSSSQSKVDDVQIIFRNGNIMSLLLMKMSITQTSKENPAYAVDSFYASRSMTTVSLNYKAITNDMVYEKANEEILNKSNWQLIDDRYTSHTAFTAIHGLLIGLQAKEIEEEKQRLEKAKNMENEMKALKN